MTRIRSDPYFIRVNLRPYFFNSMVVSPVFSAGRASVSVNTFEVLNLG